MNERYPTGRSTQDRFETPAGTGYQAHDGPIRGPSLVDNRELYRHHRAPRNDFQALMEAGPMCDPAVSEETLVRDWEPYARMLEALTPKERAVVELVVFGEKSLRETGVVLGVLFPRNNLGVPYSKDTVLRIRNRAYLKLKESIHDNLQ